MAVPSPCLPLAGTLQAWGQGMSGTPYRTDSNFDETEFADWATERNEMNFRNDMEAGDTGVC